jgi:hypothetical protein
MAAQRPSVWIEFGMRLGQALLSLAWRYVSKRMPPEEKAAWRQAARRGRGVSGCGSDDGEVLAGERDHKS